MAQCGWISCSRSPGCSKLDLWRHVLVYILIFTTNLNFPHIFPKMIFNVWNIFILSSTHIKFLLINHLKLDFRHWLEWTVVNEFFKYLTEYQSEWIPFRSEAALINEFVVISQTCLNGDERSYTAAMISSAAVALCTIHFSHSEPFLPSLLNIPQLLLIRPVRETLILVWVKTLLPFGCGDSSFSLGVIEEQQWWKIFFWGGVSFKL